jgi:hypothetical protein
MMPHDKDGELLQVGDFVDVRFEVKEIHMAGDYCNTTLVVPGEHGSHNVVSTLVVNAKQTKLVRQG